MRSEKNSETNSAAVPTGAQAPRRPFSLRRHLGSVYVYSFAASLTVTDAVWVALLAARGFTLGQIGLAEGIFHAVSLLGEVPSGMAADLLGRRRTLAVSGLLSAAACALMAFAPGFGLVCAGMGVKALSYNLMSGTREALTYDGLKQAGQEERYLQVDANCCQLSTLALILADAASLLVNALGYVGMYLLEGTLGLARSLCTLWMAEPAVTAQQAARDRQPLRTLPRRLARLCRDTLAYLRGAPQAALCIAANAVICLPCYLTTMFLQQRLVEMGLPAAWLGLPMLAVWVLSLAGVEAGRRLKVRSLRRLYGPLAFLCGLGAVLCGAGPMAAAVPGAGLVQFTTSLWMLHAERWLNDRFPSDQRATLVSVDSMAYSVLMIPVSPLVGLAADLTGFSGAGLCLLGLAVALSAAGSLPVRGRR